LGLVLALNVPSTVEEFDQNAKRVGACLASAINNEVYRGTMAEFREVLIHGSEAVVKDGVTSGYNFKGLEERFDFPRLTKKTGKTRDVVVNGTTVKEEIEVYDESESDYIKRLCAAKGWNDDKTKSDNLQPIADELSGLLTFDASQTERKAAGPKKLAKQYREAAENIFKNENQNKWVGRLKEENDIILSFDTEPAPEDPTFAAVRNGNIDKLGWAIKAREDAKAKEAVKQYA
jgi:hypothetical protein